MAGICGWLGGGGPASAEQRLKDLREMTRRLGSGRSPVLHHEDEGALGVAPAPGQTPSLHHDDRIVVGWVGRIDWQRSRHRDTALELGEGRTIANAYAEHGPDFLSDIYGDVALALLDRRRNELLLAIDRAGVRSLVYCPTPSGAAFASTGAALGAHPDVPRSVDPQAIFDFIYFHMVPSPKSIFQQWRKLRPAEYVLVRGGNAQHHRYWTPRYTDHAAGESESDLASEYRETARRAVTSCVEMSDGRIGAFLSGGTDSSTIAGLVGDVTGEPANTYSIGFDVPGYDESSYAQIAVRHFGTNHHDYTVTPSDVLEAAPQLAEAYDEPFGNASAVGTLFCARLAHADGIGTLLGGDGGDEIFAGNERYAKQKIFERYYQIPALVRTKLVEPVVGMLPGNGFPIGKAKSYVRQARTPLPDRLESFNFLQRIPPAEIFSSEFLDAVDTGEPLTLLRERYAETPSDSTLHRLLYLDLKFTLADNDLRKVSRTCEMAGVEARYPFLDPGLVDFANRVPPALKLKGQTLRYFFKRASAGFLPPEILGKSKHGFGVPCGRWMRDEPPLRELAYDSLASLGRRGYMSPAFIERLKTLHQGEHVDYYGVMVWVLTMLELWHHHHVD
jgi:asparagine synthase (glutamine-hydrolysing)